MSEYDAWLVVRYLHLLAMAFFVGGQIVFAAAVMPVLRKAEPPRLRAVARRFGYGSIAALAVLLATGTAIAAHQDRWDDGMLQLKLGLVAAVLVLTVLHLRWPRLHAIHAVVLLASLAIVWLGMNLAH